MRGGGGARVARFGEGLGKLVVQREASRTEHEARAKQEDPGRAWMSFGSTARARSSLGPFVHRYNVAQRCLVSTGISAGGRAYWGPST